MCLEVSSRKKEEPENLEKEKYILGKKILEMIILQLNLRWKVESVWKAESALTFNLWRHFIFQTWLDRVKAIKSNGFFGAFEWF